MPPAQVLLLPFDADRELVAYKQAQEQACESLQDIRAAVTGRQTPGTDR